MKPTNYLILFAAFAVLILSGCYNTDTTMSLDKGVVSHFSYQPGTYWIYKDSVSGQVDSVVVTGNKRGTYQVSDDKYSDIEIRTVKYTYGVVVDSGFYINWILYSKDVEIRVGSFTSNRPEIITKTIYPFQDAKAGNIISQMSVSGHSYTNVARLITNSSSEIFAIADIGIVKMRLISFPGAPVWELQRANIVIK